MDLDGLPGADLFEKGVADLARGIVSVEALLASVAAPRMARIGIEVPGAVADPERKLYDLLAESDPDSAHSRYNALIRRLISFEQAVECGGW